MMPSGDFSAWREVAQFATALAVTTGAMAWFRRGSAEEDKVVSEANDLILESLSDADKVAKIKDETWNDLRDQISVEQVQELHEERNLRKWGWGRN